MFGVIKAIIRLSGRLSHNGGEQPSINVFNTNALQNQIPVDLNVLSPFHAFFFFNKTTKNESLKIRISHS